MSDPVPRNLMCSLDFGGNLCTPDLHHISNTVFLIITVYFFFFLEFLKSFITNDGLGRNSSVGIATRYGLDSLGIESRRG